MSVSLFFSISFSW